MRERKVGAGEMDIFHDGVCKVGIAEIGVVQKGIGQIGAGKIGGMKIERSEEGKSEGVGIGIPAAEVDTGAGGDVLGSGNELMPEPAINRGMEGSGQGRDGQGAQSKREWVMGSAVGFECGAAVHGGGSS